MDTQILLAFISPRDPSHIQDILSLSSLAPLAAGISLFGPTTDVAQNTLIDCQWNAVTTDPATFSLVMQLSNGTADFGENALLTIVQRGNRTTGEVSRIKIVLLEPHRLAAYVDPFDPTTEPFAVSPSFQVVANSMYGPAAVTFSPSIYRDLTPIVQYIHTLQFFQQRLIHSSHSTPSKSRIPIVVAATIGCAALTLGILGTVFFILRRRKARKLDLLGGRPFPLSTPDPEPINPRGHRAAFITTPVFSAPLSKSQAGSSSGSSGAVVVARLFEKTEMELEDLRAEIRGLRLGQDALPPSWQPVRSRDPESLIGSTIRVPPSSRGRFYRSFAISTLKEREPGWTPIRWNGKVSMNGPTSTGQSSALPGHVCTMTIGDGVGVALDSASGGREEERPYLITERTASKYRGANPGIIGVAGRSVGKIGSGDRGEMVARENEEEAPGIEEVSVG
ncbi:hypothetical protein B0H13DRAFT_2577609 [Mycena leptocephala]|nr:hypothetical protein B0H13DRAFT_2577609 [Mycena leptocephala]